MNEVPLYRMRATLHCCPARGQQLEVLFYVHLENEKPRTKCGVDVDCLLVFQISSGQVFMDNARAQRKLLHTWVI